MNFIKTLTLCVLITIPAFGLADELTAEKKQRIDILLEKTGAARIGDMISGLFIRQAMTSIQQRNPNVDHRVYEVISDEVKKTVNEEVEGANAINEIIYPIYHKYLNLAEINEIIQFYETPLGEKILTVMPKITQEGMQAGSAWGRTLSPKIQKRVFDRLELEGIKLN